MVARALQLLAILGAGAAVVYAASWFGRGPAIIATVACLLLFGTVYLWLPRAAHKRFERGDFGRAAIYYHVLRRCRFGKATRGAVDVSLAACALAQDRWVRSLRILDGLDPDSLSDSARAAWLNNRAYVLVRSGDDMRGALECSERALALRPDVAGFRHTHGVALLGVGRVNEAIRELDSLWKDLAGGDVRPLLEAERCFDLGVAWRRKGEADYARDYFERAQRAAPDSRWAERALEHLDGPRPSAALAEFMEA